jgi:hypothetical protein
VRLTFRLDADSRPKEGSYDRNPDFHNGSIGRRAGNWQVNGM